MNKIIALHGATHVNNYGDVLLMQIFAGWIRECSDGVEVCMPFASPAVRSMVGASERVGPSALMAADGLLFGGGGYFGEPDHGAMRWGLRFVKKHYPVGLLSKLKGIPFGIVGVGAGPLTNIAARRAAVHLCKVAEIAAVRDLESVSHLARYGVPREKIQQTADAALTLTEEQIPVEARDQAAEFLGDHSNRMLIGVHLSQYDKHSHQLANLKNDVVRLAKMRPDAMFVLINDHEGAGDQLTVIREMQARLGAQAIAYYYSSPTPLTALLAELDCVITSKLHVGIVATALGTTAIAFPKHGKTERFYRQVGAADRCIELAEYRSGILIDLYEHHVQSGVSYRVPAEVRSAAKENQRLVTEFVGRVVKE